MRTTHLPESEAGQGSALGATTCQRHSPNVGNQAPEKKRERPLSFAFSIIHLCEKFGRENREERESSGR
ncbi:hypothetical protein N665_0642s0022 [Sinapis alba]|nr:hypothetical protein N665_0642s0022 [Sinapis alba]